MTSGSDGMWSKDRWIVRERDFTIHHLAWTAKSANDNFPISCDFVNFCMISRKIDRITGMERAQDFTI